MNYKKMWEELKVVSDTWKRAYELACAFLARITQDNVCDYEDYFYQQAKKDLKK